MGKYNFIEKYRSIDAGWDFEDIIYTNEPTESKEPPLVFNLTINGQKAIGIHHYRGDSICGYFKKIKFTGVVTASSVTGRYGLSKYVFLNGKLHCENGPAITHKDSEVVYQWFKRGKVWNCLLDGNGKRVNSATRDYFDVYFKGEKVEYNVKTVN